MVIKFKNYEIRHSLGINSYDLHIITIVEKGKTKGQEKDKAIGFGMSLERCFLHIIQEVMEEEKEEVNLDEFIEEYKSLQKELLEVAREIVKKI